MQGYISLNFKLVKSDGAEPSRKKSADHQIMYIYLFWVCPFLCKQKQL